MAVQSPCLLSHQCGSIFTRALQQSSSAAVALYMKTSPKTKTVRRMCVLTQCNLHWLWTEQGQKRCAHRHIPYHFLYPSECRGYPLEKQGSDVLTPNDSWSKFQYSEIYQVSYQRNLWHPTEVFKQFRRISWRACLFLFGLIPVS